MTVVQSHCTVGVNDGVRGERSNVAVCSILKEGTPSNCLRLSATGRPPSQQPPSSRNFTSFAIRNAYREITQAFANGFEQGQACLCRRHKSLISIACFHPRAHSFSSVYLDCDKTRLLSIQPMALGTSPRLRLETPTMSSPSARTLLATSRSGAEV